MTTRTIKWDRLGVFGVVMLSGFAAYWLGVRIWPEDSGLVRFMDTIFLWAGITIAIVFVRYDIPAIFDYFFPKKEQPK